MMIKPTLLTASLDVAARFGHLIGLKASPKAQNEAEPNETDDDSKQRADESDEDYKMRTSNKSDQNGQDKSDGDADEQSNDPPSAETDVQNVNLNDSAVNDRSSADDEMFGNTPIAAARARERERCSAIFSHPHAAYNVALTASLAFDTKMSREEAIGMLANVQAPVVAPTAHHPERSARNPNLSTGAEASVNSPAAIQASWDMAIAKVPR